MKRAKGSEQGDQRKKKGKEQIVEIIQQDEPEDGDLEFEDEWEDEYEEEDQVDAMDMDDNEIENAAEAESGDGEENQIRQGAEMQDNDPVDNDDDDNDDDDEEKEDFKVFIPGRDKLEEGEELEFDNSAYDMLHTLTVEWPCLSFDILADKLGAQRTKFPISANIVAGTQADQGIKNQILVMKFSQLAKTKHDDDDSDAEESDDDEEEGFDSDPILETRSIKHTGGVNRIRATRLLDDQTTLAASWADTGKVHIWDLTLLMKGVDGPLAPNEKLPTQPLFTFSGHSTEGFSLDWSTTSPGRLLTGDCKKFIHLWEPNESSWTVNSKPYTGHTDSVEDLQWSPNEKEVFASCSVDKTIKIWDTRRKEKSVLSVNAHSSDVNVISWNRTSPHLMLSGSDDGSFSIWDLRNFKSGVPAAHFKWHTAPITSVQWHPTEESVLAISGADDQLTIWDLSLEQDSEALQATNREPEVPPQLLFIHQGQNDIKELHWHKQIPGVIISTAQSGFNVFKTISV